MPKEINDLTPDTSPSLTDEIETQATAGGASAKVTLSNLLKLVYPVGAIYIGGASTSPATLFGFGTWTRIEGKFIVGVSDSDTDFDLDDTGGAKTVTLTEAEMPSHTHVQNSHAHAPGSGNAHWNYNSSGGTAIAAAGSNYRLSTANNTASTTATNQNTGGGGAHENLPPYIAKYIWQRTA